jgi:hypothetical protein
MEEGRIVVAWCGVHCGLSHFYGHGSIISRFYNMVLRTQMDSDLVTIK